MPELRQHKNDGDGRWNYRYVCPTSRMRRDDRFGVWDGWYYEIRLGPKIALDSDLTIQQENP